MRAVGRTGQTLSALPQVLAQAALFTLLFFQIACHLGVAHYTWTATPGWWDWLAFPLAHALRERGLDVWYDEFELKLVAHRS